MRLSVLALAIATTFALGCAQRPETRADAEAEADASAPIAETGPQLLRDQASNASPHDLQAQRAEAGAQAKAEERTRLSAPMPASMPLAPPPPPARMAQGAVLGYSQPLPQATLSGATPAEPNTENYAEFEDNGILRTADNAVSTFSIDVDTGSYSNVRRMLARGQLPPKDAVRVEEMLNYFDYGYAAPRDRSQPFRTTTALAPSPWDNRRVLMQVGLQGYQVPAAEIPAANLVFLIDTSGSMADADKLPLLKESFRQLVPRLRARDRITLVVYAGSAGLVLPPTPGDRHDEILAALDRLEAGGSTNGGEGIDLAYAMAKQAYIEGGVNRILLATDGDFNVGVYDQRALETKVEQGRESGVALSTLGFGGGNYNDALAERLADLGNGGYAYIDNLTEGRKVLVEEMGSTLLTIAGDVKVQVEFNPAQVAEYRLIGYENRVLAREDFNNDQVDAGEIGAGHDVTALYELCLVGMGCESSDPLRYAPAPASASAATASELAWLKLRYKLPGSERSVLVEQAITRRQLAAEAGEDLRFAAAVAAFADLLRGGERTNGFTWDQVEALARSGRGDDAWGYRGEFLQLLARARSLSPARDPGVAIHQE